MTKLEKHLNKIDEETKKSVQEKYLNTIDSLDYEERKTIATENLKDCEILKNDNGINYIVLAVKNDNALLYDGYNKYHPFVVAKGVYPSLRSWINGSYHSTKEVAKEVFSNSN